jgi:hypothetical protein
MFAPIQSSRASIARFFGHSAPNASHKPRLDRRDSSGDGFPYQPLHASSPRFVRVKMPISILVDTAGRRFVVFSSQDNLLASIGHS